MQKNFSEVFEKLNLSESILNMFSNVKVSDISISRSSQIMHLALKGGKVMDKNHIMRLSNELLSNFEGLKKVDVDIKYEIEDMSADRAVNFYRNFLTEKVAEKSPFCADILNRSDWYADGDKIEIRVISNTNFLMTAHGIRDMIAGEIKKNFGADIRVNISNKKISEKEKQEHIEKTRMLVQKAIAYSDENMQKQITEWAKEPHSEKKPQDGGAPYPKRVKRVKTKIERIEEKPSPIHDAVVENTTITVYGMIFAVEITETKKGKYIVKADMTDLTDSLSFKFFTDPEEWEENYKGIIKEKNYVTVKGKVVYDDYAKEILMMLENVYPAHAPKEKMDTCEEKRVELHLHTKMSAMDAVTDVKDYVKRAHKWGHKAIGITDHGVVQAYPEAMLAAIDINKSDPENPIKILYGTESYLVDDFVQVVKKSKGQSLYDEYVVFDLETTGLSHDVNKIIEIGAVKVKNGKITDKFSEFVNPGEPIPEKITELTSITDDMVKDAEDEDAILPRFFEFFGDSVLVAHNAAFDTGFIKKWAQKKGIPFENTIVDTVGLSRTLFPDMANFKLDRVAKKLNVSLENHHRAVDDAGATAEIFVKMIPLLEEAGVSNLDGIDPLASEKIDVTKLKPYHAVIYVKNMVGLRNLYELVSDSHLKYFHKRPRIPKSLYMKLNDGLMIGSACEAGELFRAVLEGAEEADIEKLAEFYDYFEIQPIGNNEFLIRDEKVSNVNNEEDLRELNRKIVALGEKYNKPVVATCDAHFLDPHDEYFRRLIMASQKFADADNQPPLFFRTTDEMLEEFAYLGEEKAKEVVITNTNIIADMIEDIRPIPDHAFPPKMEHAEEDLREMTNKRAKEIYGDPLPEVVRARLDRELDSIITHGFAVLYIIAQKLVSFSNRNGYIVGSRGSVGSSFVATMAGITEVNPLSPHYVCEKCRYSDFDSEEVKAYAGSSGWDLPDKVCPVCGEKLKKDGHDIPFETFLGFNGDKEPDIDLNFSGEIQSEAHKYAEVLFGEGHVFKAGTIGTLADKTAYGFIKKYAEERGIQMRNAEINRLVKGCVDVKRTTGQHPGGIIVVPKENSIYEFCPIQHPADDPNSDIITTHFAFKYIHDCLLKLDMLGHDVPTIIKYFKDVTGFDPLDVPMDDADTMSLFTSPEALGVTAEDIGCETGTFGIPEFGTPIVRRMLMETKPSTFSELVRISGLSHGTDVWFNNQQDLVVNGIATLKEIIPTRDDIMVYLINKGVEKKTSFTIMEKVRKGKGLTPEFEATMREHDIPDWYIDSCKKIQYMFPKGHAVAYVTNSFRLGYFKLKYPYAFYAAIFSEKTDSFDYSVMCFGHDKVKEAKKALEERAATEKLSATDNNILTTLELVNEMYARGLKFLPMDLYKSDGVKFIVTDDGLIPPFCTLQGLGANAAMSICEARVDGEFENIEDLGKRTKLSKTLLALLKDMGILDGMTETNQLSIEDYMKMA